jgi:putative ATP-binding cassette transporter
VQLPHKHALFGPRFFAHLGRLLRLYWTSSEAPRSGLLLAATVGLELGTVYGAVLLSDVQRRLFDAFEGRDVGAFSAAVGVFLGTTAFFVLASTFRIYLRGVIEIRWRRWLTDHYLARWMSSHAYCAMELHRKAVDNPDQRIAEDVREFVASALGLSLSLLAAVASLVSFAAILWSLSGNWPLQLGGEHFHIPGLMMWVAIGYALLASWITHVVGRRLVPLQFDRQRFEADFRYKLVRFRENVEPIALARGEAAERRMSLERFQYVVANWWSLIRAQRNLTLLTTGIGQANTLVPLLVAAPAYFAGQLTLGSVMQVRIAYGEVSGALTWFVNAYQEIARWRATIERLVTLSEEIDAARAELADKAGVHVDVEQDGGIRIEHLRLTRPDGHVLIEDADAVIAPGDRVALVGPTGSGKRTLLRAIAGIWRFGRGRVAMPAHTRAVFLPQRPHLPIGTLRAAISYPSAEGAFSDQEIHEALAAVGLESLADKLDESEHWQQYLSGGEQQRLAFARTLLHRPDWIFLDEATSGLDEEAEARLYEQLHERLPAAAVVSIADRPSVRRHHARQWTLEPQGDSMALRAA